MRGAIGESLHVFVEAGFGWLCEEHRKQGLTGTLRIFEAGFGSGLNALLTARRAESLRQRVEYHTVELYPVAAEVVAGLDYGDPELLQKLHAAPWGEPSRVTPWFSIRKEAVSLLEYPFAEGIDLVYFDAFAPDAQPELWSETVFRTLRENMIPGGALVTYSAKGMVKENLRAAGFTVQRLPGALGKRHMLRALKNN